MIPRAFYDLDNPDNNALALIEKTLVDINPEWEGRIVAENDNAVVKKKILADKKERSTNALILGSSWDKQLAVDTESILVRNAMPITDLVITNKTYVGYNGGLALLADIYSGLFNKGMISKTTNAE
jgi:nitrogenase molybdenum-iron protein beta chain